MNREGESDPAHSTDYKENTNSYLSTADKALLANLFGNNEELLESVTMVKAPRPLRKKLRVIPSSRYLAVTRQHWGKAIMSIAASIIVVFFVFNLTDINNSSEVALDTAKPTMGQIKIARDELAITFHYLSLAGKKTGHSVKSDIGRTVKQATLNGLFILLKNNEEVTKELKDEKTG